MNRIVIVLLGLLLIPVGIFFGMVIPNQRIEDELASQGFRNVHTSMAFFPSHPFDFACSGKHPFVRNWTAERDNVQYKGDACFTFLTGAKVWVDN